MNKNKPLILSALTFTLGLSALTAALAQGGSTVKVGVIMPTSGVYTQLGEEGMKGFNLYMDSVGRKVAGKTIQVIQEDEEADPAVAVRKANKLINNDKVDILAGVVLAPSAYALSPIAAAAKTPLIVFNAAGNALTRDRKSPYVFRTSGTSWQYNNPFGTYVARKISKDVFLIGADYAFGREFLADFKSSYTASGGKIAGEVYTPLGVSDFSPYLARIAAAKPGAVYVVLGGGDAVLFMKQFAQFGLNKTTKLAVFGDVTDESLLGAEGDATLGVINALTWAVDAPGEQNALFVNSYKAKYKNLPGIYAERGWDLARTIVEALKKTKGNVSDTPALLSAIRGVNFASPRGPFRFDPETQNVINPVYVREVVRGPDGLYNKTVIKLGNFKDPGK